MSPFKLPTSQAARAFTGSMLVAIVAAGGLLVQDLWGGVRAADALHSVSEPSNSSSIAITSISNKLVVANAEKNSVTILNITNPAIAPAVIAEVPVGKEPRNVAISNDDLFAYVTNQADGTVSVINLTTNTVAKTVTVGTEPYGIAVTPFDGKVWVANSASDTISVIRPSDNTVERTIDVSSKIHNPRGIAITGGVSPIVYVTQFISTVKNDPKTDQMKDDGKVGQVLAIDGLLGTLGSVARLNPVSSGFTSTISSGLPTKTFPNQLQSIFISGTLAYLPNVGESPERPPVFDSSTQALVSVMNIAGGLVPTDTALSINTNQAVAEQTAGAKLFYAVPWAMAMEPSKQRAWVVSLAAENIFALKFAANGAPSVVTIPDLVTPTLTRTLEVPLTDFGARSPTGIAIRQTGTTLAYVLSEVSRNLVTIDLSTVPTPTVKSTVQVTPGPTPGAEAAANAGKELFNSSIGVFDQIDPNTGKPVRGRMSTAGWQACVSCHPGGLTDGVVFQFAAGPRKSISMDSTFNPHDPTDQRFLNYSALNDEVADFENNTRGVSSRAGTQSGTIISSTSPLDISQFNPTAPLAAPNATKPQLTIRGIPAQQAITAYFSDPNFGIRTPKAPLEVLNATDVAAGRTLFFQANCQSCHGGGKWSNSRVDYTGAPPAGRVVTDTAQPTINFIQSALFDVGTFGTGVSEIAANGQTALGGPGSWLTTTGTTLNGNSLGFNIPSLLGIGQLQPYFHNGICETLECVLSDAFKTHRTAGNANGTAALDNPANRSKLVAFLRSIDDTTAFPTAADIIPPRVYLPIAVNNYAGGW